MFGNYCIAISTSLGEMKLFTLLVFFHLCVGLQSGYKSLKNQMKTCFLTLIGIAIFFDALNDFEGIKNIIEAIKK